MPEPGRSKKDKLKRIRKIAEDAAETASLDDQYPPDWVEEILSVLNGTDCLECGHPGPETVTWGQSHYTHCSQYRPVVIRHTGRRRFGRI